MKNRPNKALNRNLNEVLKALYEFTVLTRLEKSFPNVFNNEEFFGIAYEAVFNDMIAHSIKLFEKHRDSASLWYIYNCNQKEIETLWRDTGNLNKLKEISMKLKSVRDKTHFHIDKKGVMDTKQIWKDANIKPEFLKECLLIAYKTLNHIFKLENKVDFPWKPNTYKGDEIPHYIRTLKNDGYL